MTATTAARFVVRVVLQDARQESDYEDLHGLMEAAGFTRTVLSRGESTFRLPPALYLFVDVSGTMTEQEVRDAALRAAKKAEHAQGVFVRRVTETTLPFFE